MVPSGISITGLWRGMVSDIWRAGPLWTGRRGRWPVLFAMLPVAVVRGAVIRKQHMGFADAHAMQAGIGNQTRLAIDQRGTGGLRFDGEAQRCRVRGAGQLDRQIAERFRAQAKSERGSGIGGEGNVPREGHQP